VSEDIKQAVQQVFEKVWNQGDTSTADQIFADNYVAHIADIPSPINSVDEFKQFVALFRALSPGICFTIEDQVAEGDKVATRWSARLQTSGSPAAESADEGTLVTGMSMHRMTDGKLVESWDNWDSMTAFQSMGQDLFESLSLNM
jgi:predicted SnoaL-like aldol condensation-catalyzing enzyme